MYPTTRCHWRSRLLIAGAAWLYAHTTAAAAPTPQEDAELEALRAELAALRRDYTTRLAALEERLAAAEATSRQAADQAIAATQAAATAPAAAPAAASTAGGARAGGGNAFNPAIGVILQGQAWHTDRDAEEYRIPGYPLGGEAGPPPRGLALGETELGFSANVDDLFTAWLTLPVVIEDGDTKVELEEAWVETLALPGGLAARFGRFYSNIGYLNKRHSHAWDFIDQPLAYQAFLGNQYLDDGVQLRWLPPTDVYLELGAELLRGDRFPAGGAANDGLGAQSLSARLGGDVGYSNSWQAGVSWLHSRSEDRPSGPEDTPLLFTGTSDLLVAELLWKWAPRGNWKARNLILQSELLWRNEDGSYALPDGTGADVDDDQFGWYAQIVYQPVEQWRVGARMDRLSGAGPGAAFAGTALDPDGGDPERYSLMVDWSRSEFSRLRLQYSRDLSGAGSDDQWGLQYIHSIGAHGAHSF